MLSRGKRAAVRAIALLFFVLGAVRIAEAPLPLVAPGYIGWSGSLSRGVIGEPEALLPEAARFKLAADPALRTRYLRRLETPDVRTAHFLLTLLIDVPVIVILCGMGVALWRSTRLVPEAVESGLPWLMAVGWACVAISLGFPIVDGFRTGMLVQGVLPGHDLFWYDPDTGATSYIMLLIAAGILAATWTISAGLKARADMAEIV
ncbi:hypothetical protein [Sphingomonas sp. M1-B02]|uniref:hypothetical protein n=1 Tax=Sphingomonas sp. M1-B02 TaxID=3114300 RepID=UPI002240B413|nr:hypothetical protein [Sphingomonas sp. S6-11]UZK65469.1 hypothetical protein OKW87_13260 [Sphingomonas sp. S6-11]